MQKKMKTALVLTIDFPPMGGGMARHCMDVCEALRRAGISPVVIAPAAEGPAGEPSGDIKICRLKSLFAGRIFDHYILSVLSFFFGALKACMTDKAAFVMANTWSVAGVAAFLIKKTIGVPYAVFAHGLDIYSSRAHSRVQRLMSAVLNNAAVVIANSNFTKELVTGSAERANVAVLHPTADLKRFTAHDAGDQAGASSREILTVARLVGSKGHELVIRSLPDVIGRFPDSVYRIVGGGPKEAALKALTDECKVAEHVIFEGEVPDSALAGYYRGCDVFVMTSREIPERGEVEGFGIAFLEAGLFGKPVIGSRSGGIPDAVESGVTGVLVDPDDPLETSAAIIKLFSDPELAKRMGQAGRLRAEKGFGPEAFSGRLKEIVEREVKG